MKYLLLLLISYSSWAVDLKKHPIYAQIKRHKPDINSRYAMVVSNYIARLSAKYKLPKHIFTAILLQESGLRLNVKSRHYGYRKDVRGNYVKTLIYADFGISQIYWKTAESYGFDISKLTTDLKYSLEAGAKVLYDFKRRFAKKEKYWYTRYNASNKIKRKIYRELIHRYL